MADQLGGGVILVKSHAKARRQIGNVDLARRHHCWRHPAYALDSLDAGGEANLGR